MYIVQYKPVRCNHRENICFCEQLGKLLPITKTAGKSSWEERLEGCEAFQDAAVSGKFIGNINIPAERSLHPESSWNILSQERITGPAEFWGDPCYHSRCWHFEQISLPDISSHQPTLLKKDQTLPLVALFPLSIFFFLSIFSIHLFFHLFSFPSSMPKRGVLVQDEAMLQAHVLKPHQQAEHILSLLLL